MGHIDNFKKFRNKEAKAITEQDSVTDMLSVPEKFKADSDAITQKKTSIIQLEQQIVAEKTKLNNMVKALQGKISAENAAVANANKATAQTTPPTV